MYEFVFTLNRCLKVCEGPASRPGSLPVRVCVCTHCIYSDSGVLLFTVLLKSHAKSHEVCVCVGGDPKQVVGELGSGSLEERGRLPRVKSANRNT